MKNDLNEGQHQLLTANGILHSVGDVAIHHRKKYGQKSFAVSDGQKRGRMVTDQFVRADKPLFFWCHFISPFEGDSYLFAGGEIAKVKMDVRLG